jgi:alpha-glutamyl/putrescinyl thymine pyrophosphorylase clade 1
VPKVQEAVDPDRLAEFLEFASERHRVWEKRQAGEPGPWTTHPALACRKFTNVYRVIDYGSQWLFTSGWIDPEAEPRDQLMRLFLYRHTGRWESWDVFREIEGELTVDSLPLARDVLKSYRGRTTTTVRGKEARNAAGAVKNVFERSVFTSAYLVFPQSTVAGTDKLDSIFDLTHRLFAPWSVDDIVPDFLKARSQAERFKCLRRNKGVADFMSQQVLTDWGMTPHCGEFREDDFLVPGPGSRKGAAVLAPGARAEDVARWAWETVRAHPDCPMLEGRPPSLMDVGSNLLCEFSKLARYVPSGVGYTPTHPGPQPKPILPVWW